MELYDKEYFASLKKRIKVLDKKPILFSLNYLVVSVIFFFVWANMVLGESPNISGVTINISDEYSITFLQTLAYGLISAGLVIPLVLFYNIVIRKSSKSLLFVIVIMSSTIFIELFDLAYYYDMYLDDLPINDSEICPICEVETSIQVITISLMAILLMINKPMAAKFSLNKKNILLAIFLPSLILLLRIILFFRSSFL